MNKFKRAFVWLSRIFYCRGFGIQSPTDYAFVRYVVNEHWSYYAYQQLDSTTDLWLERKLGHLYFRLANWRQPSAMPMDKYAPYWQAGCRKTKMLVDVDVVELMRVTIESITHDVLLSIYNKVDTQSVLVVEGIDRNRELWHTIEHDSHTGVTFDLYYCGIVFFDKKRQKKNYKVNF